MVFDKTIVWQDFIISSVPAMHKMLQ